MALWNIGFIVFCLSILLYGRYLRQVICLGKNSTQYHKPHIVLIIFAIGYLSSWTWYLYGNFMYDDDIKLVSIANIIIYAWFYSAVYSFGREFSWTSCLKSLAHLGFLSSVMLLFYWAMYRLENGDPNTVSIATGVTSNVLTVLFHAMPLYDSIMKIQINCSPPFSLILANSIVSFVVSRWSHDLYMQIAYMTSNYISTVLLATSMVHYLYQRLALRKKYSSDKLYLNNEQTI